MIIVKKDERTYNSTAESSCKWGDSVRPIPNNYKYKKKAIFESGVIKDRMNLSIDLLPDIQEHILL